MAGAATRAAAGARHPVGLEDVLVLPDGRRALSNAQLVRAGPGPARDIRWPAPWPPARDSGDAEIREPRRPRCRRCASPPKC